ncbi:hypothetical protein EOM09_07490 [bacterium]|nr:hypothetical protein [bacterium]
MNKKILLFMFVMILLVFPTFASELIFTSNTDSTLSISCFNDGNPCINGECYISKIVDTNGNIIKYNEEMNNLGSNVFIYNFSLNKTGNYNYNIYCKEGNKSNIFSGDFEVQNQNNLWSCPDTSQKTMILSLIIGLAVLLIIFALITKYSIFGVLGGIILFFSYFFIGACAPLLTAPLLVAGILITILFAT